MQKKKTARLRKALRARIGMRERSLKRLTVHRTPKHIYAQIVDDQLGKTLVSASSLEKGLREEKLSGNVTSAIKVGKLLAQKAVEAGITEVAFDRSGFKYHVRVKALADSARESGLKF